MLRQHQQHHHRYHHHNHHIHLLDGFPDTHPANIPAVTMVLFAFSLVPDFHCLRIYFARKSLKLSILLVVLYQSINMVTAVIFSARSFTLSPLQLLLVVVLYVTSLFGCMGAKTTSELHFKQCWYAVNVSVSYLLAESMLIKYVYEAHAFGVFVGSNKERVWTILMMLTMHKKN